MEGVAVVSVLGRALLIDTRTCVFVMLAFPTSLHTQAKDPLVFGPANKHMPKLVQSFVEVLGRGTGLVDEPLGRRIATLLSALRPSVPGDMLEAGFNGLSDKQKAAFSAYMAGQPLSQ